MTIVGNTLPFIIGYSTSPSYDNPSFYQRTGFRNFGEITKSFSGLLYKKAMKLTRCPNDAEDLVQDTLERALTQFDKFNPDFNPSTRNIEAWLSTIQYHLFINHYRRGQKEKEILHENSEILAEMTFGGYKDNLRDFVSDADFKENGLPKVQAKLEEMTGRKEYAQVFWTVEYLGMSYHEAAKFIGVPKGTIMSRLYRARKNINQYLFQKGVIIEPSSGRRIKNYSHLKSNLSLDERVLTLLN